MSGTERPRLSFPPGVFALSDWSILIVRFAAIQVALKHTLWNQFSASGGMLYFCASCDTSCTSWGKTASKSAREVLALMLKFNRLLDRCEVFSCVIKSQMLKERSP